MDQSTRDRICSRSWTDGQVAVEINWTGPVTLICLVSQSCQSSQARSDQISADALLACLLSQSLPTTTLSSHDLDNLIQTKGRRFTQVPTAVRPDWGRRGEGGHSQGPQTGEAGTINQSLASDKYHPSQIEQNIRRAELVPEGGGGANMALCPELKLEGRRARDDTCNRQFGTGLVGSNTTRSRLVALRSVPFTRIPGLLAHGRANEVLVDSCPRLLLGTWGGTGWTDSGSGAVGCRRGKDGSRPWGGCDISISNVED